MSRSFSILIAEDDELDVLLLKRAFQDANFQPHLSFVDDGKAAMDALETQRNLPDKPMPSLVILDLKMPRRTGFEVLQWIRQQPVLRTLPVFIFSSSARREDVDFAYYLGANSFMVKPPSTAKRVEMVYFVRDWLLQSELPTASTNGYSAAQAVRIGDSPRA